MLNDLEVLDNHLSAVSISSFVVASYLRLAALENQTRDVQVTVQHRPLLRRSGSAVTRVFVTGDGGRKHFSLSAAEPTGRATRPDEPRPRCPAAAGKTTSIKPNLVTEA